MIGKLGTKSVVRMLAVFVVSALAATGCNGSGGNAGPDVDTDQETTSSVSPTETPDGGSTTEVAVYFARGESLGVVMRTVPATDQTPHDAIDELLGGPTAQESDWGFLTEVPEGTKLNSVDIANGTATVDLSGEFDDGGGSLSMQLRAAEVVFTLTQFPDVESVDFVLDGQPIDALGGEGVDVDGVGRTDFDNVLPMILVEAPTPGASVASPMRVNGLGNTFEGTLIVEVIDPDGDAVTEQAVFYVGGMGTWGRFTEQVEFETASSGWGKIVFYEESMQDGSRMNVVEIPVQMGD